MTHPEFPFVVMHNGDHPMLLAKREPVVGVSLSAQDFLHLDGTACVVGEEIACPVCGPFNCGKNIPLEVWRTVRRETA